MTQFATTHPQAAPGQKLWTADELEELRAGGILDPDTTYELIDGILYAMAGMNTPHYRASVNCMQLLMDGLSREQYLITQELPVRLSPMNEPKPDLCVLRGSRSDLLGRDAPLGADDVAVVIEISDSSYRHDSTTKLSVYALERLPEYWIVNIPERTVEVHTGPNSKALDGEIVGIYDQTSIYREGKTLESTLGAFAVSDLLEYV